MTGIAITFMVIALVVEFSVLGFCLYNQITKSAKLNQQAL